MNWFLTILTGYAWSKHTTGRRYGTKTPDEIIKDQKQERANIKSDAAFLDFIKKHKKGQSPE